MEKTVLISLSVDELQSIIIESVSACIKHSKHLQANLPEEDRALDKHEAADFLNITARTVTEYARKGKIRSSKRAGKLYFFKKDLTEWLKAGSRKTNSEISAEANTYIQSKKKKAPNDRV